LSAGARIDDPLVEAVLLDDANALGRIASTPGQHLDRKVTVVSAYTSCRGVSALHLCAEFNAVHCAAALLKSGLDVNTRAELDANGFGGQTPLFHAVNSNQNYCRPMMELLVNAGADLDVRLKGLVWGEGFDWETVLFDVTPVSYAQAGLYRQFHRHEEDVFDNVAFMYRKRFGSDPPVRNVPNRYLAT
jgi:ankyrin repeat protein